MGNWFKLIVPVFLTCLLRKLQFLKPMVDCDPPELLSKLRLSTRTHKHTYQIIITKRVHCCWNAVTVAQSHSYRLCNISRTAQVLNLDPQ